MAADAFRFQPLFSKRLILITMLFGCSNASFLINTILQFSSRSARLSDSGARLRGGGAIPPLTAETR